MQLPSLIARNEMPALESRRERSQPRTCMRRPINVSSSSATCTERLAISGALVMGELSFHSSNCVGVTIWLIVLAAACVGEYEIEIQPRTTRNGNLLHTS